MVGVASARTFDGGAIATVCAAFGSGGGAAFGSGGNGVTGGSGGGEGDFERMRTSRTGSSIEKSVDTLGTGTNGWGAGLIGDEPSAMKPIGYGGGGAGGGAKKKPGVGTLTVRMRGNPVLVGPYSMKRMPMTPHPAAMHRRRRKVATCSLAATVRPG